MSLANVQVLVAPEASVLSDSPRVDLLLVQRESGRWTDVQRARLPDGVRDRAVLAESSDLRAYILGLRETLNVKGEWEMAEAPTPEMVLEYGKKIRQLIFETGTPEERLAGLSAEERRKLLRLLQEELDADAGDEAGRNGDDA